MNRFIPLLLVLLFVSAVTAQNAIDCDTLTVRVLHTIYDTVRVVVIDTVHVPANLWSASHLIVARDPFAWPPDTAAWKAEIWLYDPVTTTAAGWVAKMRCIGMSGDNRIFEIDSTSLPPQNIISQGGIGPKQLLKRLDEIRGVKKILLP